MKPLEKQNGRAAAPSPEVMERPQRRKFTAEYKLKILKDAEGCEEGKLGEMLRREGLYGSHLITWRRQRDQGALSALEPKRRGRKPKRRDAMVSEVERLRRENGQLQRRLHQAEAIIDVQKKVSELLGIPLGTDEKNGRDD